MEEAGFDARSGDVADLVLTGEGRIDEQTAYGKTALGVARRAQAAGKRVHRGRRRRDAGGDRGAGRGRRVAVPVVERRRTVEEAMAAGIGAGRAVRRAARAAVQRARWTLRG